MNMTFERMVYGRPERSTRHATFVNRVRSHLKNICVTADKETGLVSSRITDAWGYNKDLKTWYICEVKVTHNDLQKAVTQIHDQVHRFKPKNKPVAVIPIIAIPNQLFIELKKYYSDKWTSFRSLCKTLDVAIWIIEQSNVKQIQGPKPKSSKPKTRKSPVKSKTTVKRKATAKIKAAKIQKSSTKTKSKTKPSAKVKSIKKRKPTVKKKPVRTRSKTVKKR